MLVGAHSHLFSVGRYLRHIWFGIKIQKGTAFFRYGYAFFSGTSNTAGKARNKEYAAATLGRPFCRANQFKRYTQIGHAALVRYPLRFFKPL